MTVEEALAVHERICAHVDWPNLVRDHAARSIDVLCVGAWLAAFDAAATPAGVGMALGMTRARAAAALVWLRDHGYAGQRPVMVKPGQIAEYTWWLPVADNAGAAGDSTDFAPSAPSKRARSRGITPSTLSDTPPPPKRGQRPGNRPERPRKAVTDDPPTLSLLPEVDEHDRA